MCGWNEPEQVKHDRVHIKVDSALIDQLRAGYAELNARDSSRAQRLEFPPRGTLPRTHNAINDDVSLASFVLPLVKVADLTESEANLLASVYRVTNKAVAHLTSDSRHPQLDMRQYRAACTLLHKLMSERLLSRY